MNPPPPRADHQPPGAPALARLLDHTANAVQAVREGRSLADILPAVPAAVRPGVQALAFTVLRRLGAAMEARAVLAPKKPPAAVEALLLVGLVLLWPDEAPPYAEYTLVDQAVAAARRRTPAAAGFVNAVLRRFVRERAQVVEAAGHTPLGAHNHPPWWVQRLQQDWPDHWRRMLQEANRHPPMTLRVNARRCSAQRYVEQLAQQGIGAHLVPLPGLASPLLETGGHGIESAAVVLAEPRPVAQLPGFAEGDVSVQDAAAQCAAPLLLGGAAAPSLPRPEHGAAPGSLPAGAAPLATLRPGARVLDACAAPGGKTAHLLELAELELVALDVDAQRLARVRENLARLRLDGTSAATPARPAPRVLTGDAREPAAWWDGRPFDAILLDAPCTASGIVRRHPDVRWLRRPSDIEALAAVQAQMLEALWPLLAPGGRLLYATCSIFRTEGERQIDAFLQRHGPASARLWAHSPGHLLPLADNSFAREPGATAPSGTPPKPEPATSDGFFYALIEKT